MKIITQAKAIEIITIHGNLNEFYYFIKELGNKKEYKLKDVKKDVIQGKIDEMKKAAGDKNWKPTKEQLALYELEARRKVGELISFRLQNGTYTVAK